MRTTSSPSSPAPPTSPAHRSGPTAGSAHHLFRPEALAYLQAPPERQALPGFALPGAVWASRSLIVLLLVALAALWFVRVPTVVAGRAMVASATASGPGGEIVVLVPAAGADRLRPGQPLTLTPDGATGEATPVSLVVTAVEPDSLSSQAQRDRFGAGMVLAGPARVVRAALAGNETNRRSLPSGIAGTARIDTGSERLVERLPLGDVIASAARTGGV